MSVYTVAAIVVTLTALFSLINERLFRLPTPIGVMLGALLTSLALIILGTPGSLVENFALDLLQRVDFDDLLMNGLLSFLLFAGSLHINLDDLYKQRWPVLFLALLGVVISTVLVATVVSWLLGKLGLTLSWGYALIFGALISPTDPIAVLGLLRQANAPKRIETLITGESLFNDGVGVVLFTTLVAVVVGGKAVDPPQIALYFAEEAFGGILLGLLLGLSAYWLLKQVDNYTVEILITLAVVMGGYSLAGSLHVSGPLAMVVAGLFLGNRGRHFAMSEASRQRLDSFWELLDEILNSVLFVLIGMEVLVLTFSVHFLAAALVAIPVVLLARLVSVGSAVAVLTRWVHYHPYTVRLMTWGGLRGGISIALALSLPAGSERDLLLFMTYGVVAFSILVQGTTVAGLARKAVA